MANKAISATFFLVLFLVASFEMTTVKGLCERASQTWSGNCGNTSHCDNQCKTWEGAAHGACHVRSGKHMCFCYFPGCPTAQKQKELIEAAKKAQAAKKTQAAAKAQPKN